MAWTALENRGVTVIDWNHWYGEGKEGWGVRPCPAEGHPDEIDLKEAEDWGRDLVELSHRISQGETNLKKQLPKGKEYEKIYGGETYREHPRWLHHDYNVTIDEKNCTGCGLCVENCPMDNIDLNASPPVLGSCIYCTTCEAVCPSGAVDIEFERLKNDRVKIFGGDTSAGQKWAAGVGDNKQHEQRGTLLPPEKRLRMLVQIEDLGKDGFIHDITKPPRITIPEQGWKKENRK
jgi:NAD-dependent dihydropyrimidine dehydrogenase PreA subunit